MDELVGGVGQAADSSAAGSWPVNSSALDELTLFDWQELTELLSDEDLNFRLIETVDVAERYL